MSAVSFIKVLADLSVAAHQHKMPPADSWQAPQQKSEDDKNNYVKGVGQSNWGLGLPVADGIISYFVKLVRKYMAIFFS